jgi:hypothetical protein
MKKEGAKMAIIIGFMCLLFLCGSVLILSSFPISQYKQKHPIKKQASIKFIDFDSILFDVYDEKTYSPSKHKKER